MRRCDVDRVDVLATNKLRRAGVDLAGMVAAKTRTKLCVEIRCTGKDEIGMSFDCRDHGGTGHAQADDADPNCTIMLLVHYSPLNVGQTVGFDRSNGRVARIKDQALRWAEGGLDAVPP